MRQKNGLRMCMAFLAVVFTAMYVSLIFNKNIWTDEAYTIELVRENSFQGIIGNTADDVHPPLYYLIVKAFVLVFGDRFYIYKMVSVIPMALTMLLAFFCVRPWWGEHAAVIFLIMVNAVPCVMEYTVQIRMYTWALFFVTWAGLGAYGLCRQEQGKYAVWLAAASLLGCYTHTYAMLSCVCIYMVLCVYALCRGRKSRTYSLLKRAVLSGLAVAVCYLPWLAVLLRQTSDRIGNYWIEPVTGQEILGYFPFLFGSRVPYSTAMYLVLCGLAVMACIRRCVRKDREAPAALVMLGIPVMTACIGVAVSIWVTPFFIARYLLPCMGLLALFFAVAFQREQGSVKVLLGIFGIIMAVNSYLLNFQAEYGSTHTDELLAFMDDNMGERDLIAYNYEIYGFIYRIYFDGDRTLFLNDVDFAGDFGDIWYFDSCVTPWLDSGVLADHGLEKEFVMNTGIEQNAFHLYRIYHKE